jgi:hypothetical protein
MIYNELYGIMLFAKTQKKLAISRSSEELAWGNLEQTAQFLLQLQEPPEKDGKK